MVGETNGVAPVDQIPIDEFHRHEVLHVASIIAELFEEKIEQHLYTQSDPKLAAMAGEIATLLHDFYQLVGQRSFD